MKKTEAIWAINERVDGVYNDLRGFVYIRKHNLQNSSEHIGGGNITQAMALFSLLNFLGKIQYFFDVNGTIEIMDTGEPKINEEVAFIHLMRKLDEDEINLGLPIDKSDTLKMVWSGFRNKLAHVSNVEYGKQVMVYVINDPSNTLTVSGILDKVKNKVMFEHDGHHKNWRVNADVLLANIPIIKKIVVDQIYQADQTTFDYETLEKIIG
jgi:hypothetical protein